MRIFDDVTYGQYAGEVTQLLGKIKQYWIGRTATICDYNPEINGRSGKIADVRVIDGRIYFYLEDCSLSFEPEYLNLASDGKP